VSQTGVAVKVATFETNGRLGVVKTDGARSIGGCDGGFSVFDGFVTEPLQQVSYLVTTSTNSQDGVRVFYRYTDVSLAYY